MLGFLFGARNKTSTAHCVRFQGASPAFIPGSPPNFDSVGWFATGGGRFVFKSRFTQTKQKNRLIAGFLFGARNRT